MGCERVQVDVLYPIDQFGYFLALYVNIYELINWTTTDKWQMTYS
jgi:hypothetical protein